MNCAAYNTQDLQRKLLFHMNYFQIFEMVVYVT